MKLKEIFNKFKNSKYKKEIITITVIVFLITVVVTLRGTHAYYNYEMEPVPIFTSRVGNFAKQDIEEYLASQENSGLETRENMEAREDTLRRYQGSTVNNYICFGTKNKNDCLNDQDKYMYRIIGIDTTTNELMIQKKEALNTKYFWPKTATDWPNSTLYNGLIGNYFLNNKEYSYLQDNEWLSYISVHSWQYGELTNYNQTGMNLFKTEKDLLNHFNSKIGLINLSDFFLSYSNDATCSTANACTTSWMFIKNNDPTPPREWAEWTINRYDKSNPYCIGSQGQPYYVAGDELSVRPVMFISIKKLKGLGTIKEPFILYNELYKRPGATTGDTSPLDKNTDVNVIFYIQSSDTPTEYYISKYVPASGYKVNNVASNCIPTNGSITKYNDYYIDSDGVIRIEYNESKPMQVVCRIYYDRVI